jgi:hypothetical protein
VSDIAEQLLNIGQQLGRVEQRQIDMDTKLTLLYEDHEKRLEKVEHLHKRMMTMAGVVITSFTIVGEWISRVWK